MEKLFDAVRIASLNRKYESKKSPTLGNDSKSFVFVKRLFISDFNDHLVGLRFGSLNKRSMGSERTKNTTTDGRRVSALADDPKTLMLPLEKGRAMSKPANWPR